MMWEAFQADIADRGGHLLLSAKVRGLHHHNGRMTGVEFERGRSDFAAGRYGSFDDAAAGADRVAVAAAPREVRDAGGGATSATS